MGRKKKKKNIRLEISRPTEHTFISKTDYLYDNERDTFSLKNLETNYFFQEVEIFQCQLCKQQFREESLIKSHLLKSHDIKDMLYKPYTITKKKIKRLKYQKYD